MVKALAFVFSCFFGMKVTIAVIGSKAIIIFATVSWLNSKMAFAPTAEPVREKAIPVKAIFQITFLFLIKLLNAVPVPNMAANLFVPNAI